MKSGLVSKLTSVLKNAMEKLSRYDEGTMFGSILGAMVSITDKKTDACWDIFKFKPNSSSILDLTHIQFQYQIEIQIQIQILPPFS